MTLGTMAVAAGVVARVLLATVLTREQMPAQDLRATVEHSLHGSPMAGEERLPKPVQGGMARPLQDVRQLRHVRSPRASRSAMRALTAACTTSKACCVRCVYRAVGPRAFVAEDLLHDAQ